MKYITILDFAKGEVHVFPYKKFDMGEDFSDISSYIYDIYRIKFSENNCQWMISDLKLQIH